LELLRAGIASGAIRTPLDRAALVGSGIRHQLDIIERALGGHKSSACLAVLDVALAERRRRKPAPELVWTGPEGSSSTARDTAVVLRWLFESARETVILAGYSFSHARDVLQPLHASMKAHGVRTLFFVNIPQVERALAEPVRHADHCLSDFLKHNWPFGEPYPTLYYDRRALVPGPPFASLHAKCVTVDGERAFISSANFTDRGQDRNIEAGVLIDDPSFAGHLARQWIGLIESHTVHEFRTSG
jgi:phosphatidylserine/phosphatidylglycerophosphate/cardiolipin synthase-like enzyme